jgi:hypothetical protein
MKNVVAALAFVALTAGAVLAARARQEGMPRAKPQAEHEWLKQLEGTWDWTGKFFMAGPDKPPMESKGVQVDKLTVGGFWLVIDSQEEGGMKFHGHGMVGYDPVKKKYVSAWVDSIGPVLGTAEGSVGADGKSLTMTSSFPGPDGKSIKFREVSTIKDKDHKSHEIFMTGPEGEEMKFGVLEYTRKK